MQMLHRTVFAQILCVEDPEVTDLKANRIDDLERLPLVHADSAATARRNLLKAPQLGHTAVRQADLKALIATVRFTGVECGHDESLCVSCVRSCSHQLSPQKNEEISGHAEVKLH